MNTVENFKLIIQGYFTLVKMKISYHVIKILSYEVSNDLIEKDY